MQPSDSFPSLTSSALPSEMALKPNATTEEKLQLLALLVPKADNAKNRVADLHSKTVTTIDSCQPLVKQISEVNNYAQLFFTKMNPQLAAIDQLVSSLRSHRPKIIQLQQQLSAEQLRLDDFTATLDRLRSVRVHPHLRDFLLPELPTSESTGTLADWANANELLTTHRVLSDDREQMQALSDWGIRQIMKIDEKHKIVVDESEASLTILSQLAKLEVDSWLSELAQLRRVSDSVLSECLTHYAKVSEALKARDVLALPSFMANDLNLATQLLSINKCRSRVNVMYMECGNAVAKSGELVAMLQALGSETLKFDAECRELVTEFDHMEADIQSYIGPANSDADAGYSDLKRSVDAWNEFIKTYFDIASEIDRRRQVLAQHRMIAMRYQRELQALYQSEQTQRQIFDAQLSGANIPPSWNSLEFLAEPPLSFTLHANMDESVLPDLSLEEIIGDSSASTIPHYPHPHSSRIQANSAAHLNTAGPYTSHIVATSSNPASASLLSNPVRTLSDSGSLPSLRLRVPLPSAVPSSSSQPLHGSNNQNQFSPRSSLATTIQPIDMSPRSSSLGLLPLRSSGASGHGSVHLGGQGVAAPGLPFSSSHDDHLAGSATANSLLGSNFSLSESMLDDSNAMFQSATDHGQASRGTSALPSLVHSLSTSRVEPPYPHLSHNNPRPNPQ